MLPLTTGSGSTSRHALIALAWGLFVFYGSLVPLEYRPRSDAFQAFLNTPWLDLGVASRADWIANILLYIVLAYFATGAVWLSRLGGAARGLLLAVVLAGCLTLAVTIEFLQLFFPPRTVSLNDLVAELLGTAFGCIAWLAWGRRLAVMWARFIAGGTDSMRALLALYAIGYLAFSLFPYDLLVSRAEFAAKWSAGSAISVASGLTCGSTLDCSVKLIAETVLLIPFGLLLVFATTRRSAGEARVHSATGFAVGCAIGLIVEALQLLIASGITQGVSVFTRGLGVAWGVALAKSIPPGGIPYSRIWVRRGLILLAPAYVALALAVQGLLPLAIQPLWAAFEQLQQLRFIPFYYHYYTTETEAMRSLLQVAGSYAPIGFAAALAWMGTPRRAATVAILFALALSFGVETLKLFNAGQRPDPTNLLIAPATVLLIHWVAARLLPQLVRPNDQLAPAGKALLARPDFWLRPVRLLAAVVIPIAGLVLVASTVPTASRAVTPPAAAGPTTYPPPEELQAVWLPAFGVARPRLPHPSARDLIDIATYNPRYIDTQANKSGKNVEALTFTAFFEPSATHLDALYERLMARPFSRQLIAEVRRLAVAYDWLYPNWRLEQRNALRDKLADGCTATIRHLRSARLSAYQRELYTGPLQAVMACAITLYQDDPRGEAFMAFAHELWIRRVLPVWDQVFGRNGGWHEGGNLLAEGLGQAIYSMPAMWRAATGEELFIRHPGFRGFLDFVVYRTRPDGSQIRWGDGAFFQKYPPGAVPLALELRHAAAYNLAPPIPDATPTGWPWGPLAEAAMADPNAVARLPLSRHFDGIGLVVARSDWSDEATYVTFKAGDNFWSHAHLDQGTFTIYKGGPLAIDSGIQGPRYGSPHHRNYAYQTIAHNLVTVTDPDDTLPAPAWNGPQAYVNDGGQRRIGSTPGIDPAPLDRADWESQRETYHTGRITQYLEDDGLTVAVADLTPAYTNRLSGEGHFAHRTRRVERYWRTFGYDAIDDVVVIYDDITATRADFRKRWLLHSIERPEVAGNRFNVPVMPQDRRGRLGGLLEGQVLLPRDPFILAKGGRGLEFLVDGESQDEGQDLAANIARSHRDIEPGAWRIEVHPARQALEDRFLVVMLPSTLDLRPVHQVRLIESGDRVGCEIVGPSRTTRWWFEPGRQGARIEVVEHGQTRTHDLGFAR